MQLSNSNLPLHAIHAHALLARWHEQTLEDLLDRAYSQAEFDGAELPESLEVDLLDLVLERALRGQPITRRQLEALEDAGYRILDDVMLAIPSH